MILHYLIPFIIFSSKMVTSLRCVQCDMSGRWYSEEEHEEHIKACRLGLIQPTVCHNRSHTHCIVSWYRSGSNSERVVTERKCGAESDVTGCTLYNAKINRKVRHLLTNERGSASEHRRDTQASFVEVCSESCPEGNCLNSISTTSSIMTFALLVLTHLMR